MHELSIALGILDIAAEESARHGGAEVKAIHLRLGELSGVVQQALVSAFELAREGSPFPAAELVIETVPVTAHCQQCNGPVHVCSLQEMTCRMCGTAVGRVLGGREMEVCAMEVEHRTEV